jgi:pyruvate,water dikinase
MPNYIKFFNEILNIDVSIVGGKNASLGEMYQKLVPLGVRIPNGFAVTAEGYDYFIKSNNLDGKIKKALNNLDTKNIRSLQGVGEQIRNLIKNGKIPDDLKNEIANSYKQLFAADSRGLLNADSSGSFSAAVRSSATAEDLPSASFAGEHETFLNVIGGEKLLQRIKDCFASLFTDRAISYRVDKGFDHFSVKLSVGVQKMIRSDIGSSGVIFTIEPDTGLQNAIVINSIFGLGELIVQGKVIPDEFIVFKQGLERGLKPIIEKKLGQKFKKIIYQGENKIREVYTTNEEKNKFSLSDDEVIELAKYGLLIEKHYGKAMDIEWAKDGIDGKIYIVQARPETVHSVKDKNTYFEYKLKNNPRQSAIDSPRESVSSLRQSAPDILSGVAIGSKIATGKVKIIKSTKEIEKFKEGEILVAEMTDPDWEPIMKIASGIITERGGRTAHASIVSRELGIACVVGVTEAMDKLKDGEEITIDCSQGSVGKIYKGKLDFEIIEHKISEIPEIRTKVMVNIGSPDEAWEKYYLPVDGVGLAREEFIIASEIGIHPNILVDYENVRKSQILNPKSQINSKNQILNLKLQEIIKKIDKITGGYSDKKQFYIDKLTKGIAKIATAFYPREVIVRFSDFKTNEYKNLIGGELYELEEANPMLGWRGASRYYDEKFKQAFTLEVLAIKKAIFEIGLDNISVMVPFCRTPEEGVKVLNIINKYFADIRPNDERIKTNEEQIKDSLKFGDIRDRFGRLRVYVMCEIPSNVILANEFLEIFDGFSIGSNDLTQLAMGIDRDNEAIQAIANENNEAVKKMISKVIEIAKEKNKYSGICGQAPSDIEGFVEFLVERGILSISVNPDVVIQTIQKVAEAENKT